MKPQANKVYVLNPHYHLRHDIHRVVLFADTEAGTDCSRNWYTFIHPLQAVLLSFFTFNRTWKETLPQLCDFFCRNAEDLTTWVSEFIENESPVYTSSPQGEIHFPKRVLIAVKENGPAPCFLQLEPNSFAWRKLDLTTRRLYTGPLMVTFMLTNRCRTHCRYCYADTSTPIGQPLTTRRIKELIEEAALLKVQQVGLIGGEVFLHPDWKEILTLLVKRNMAPEYLSTKIPFTPQRIRDLQETGYRGMIQISLDACSPQVLFELLHVPASYIDEVMDGLHLLDESGLNYQVSSVLTRVNCQTELLVALYRRLSALKHISDWRLVPVSNTTGKNDPDFVRLKPTRSQLMDTFAVMETQTAHAPFPVILGRKVVEKEYHNSWKGSRYFDGNICSALTTHLFLLPDGKVTICEQLYWHPDFLIGDVGRHSLKEVWNSPKALRLYSLSQQDIHRDSACHTCKLFDDCFTYHNRCWSDIIKAYGKTHWDYPDPRCGYAPPLTRKLDYDY